MKEEWRAVPGYEGLYEVSSKGRVRTPGRTVTVTKTYPARIMKQAIRGRAKDGKPNSVFVALYKNAKKNQLSVHSMVLEAFIGPRPENMVGCHNDGNPANNDASNLRWDTQSGNCMDKHKHGTSPCGEKQYMHKLTKLQVIEIRKRAMPRNHAQLAREFGISHTQLTRIIKLQSWKNV